MTYLSRWLGVLILAAAAAACGSRNPTAPSGGSLTGTWSGSITGDPSGPGTARLQLTQTGSGVVGTFATTLPDASRSRSGAATGTSLGSLLTITLTPGAPDVCSSTITLSGTLAATLTVGTDRIGGSYSGLTCGGATGGLLDLRRE